MTETKKPQVGDVVTYTDHVGVKHPALITAVWGDTTNWGDDKAPGPESISLNLVYVETDPAKEDTYGRQIARDTSVPHKSTQSAPGNYWE